MYFWSQILKLHKMDKQLYLNRTIEEVITEASQYFSVISVTGPRQSGKSTLLKHLFQNTASKISMFVSLPKKIQWRSYGSIPKECSSTRYKRYHSCWNIFKV